MKKSSDTIGNRTRDLPAYSAVPQPTAPPRAPNAGEGKTKFLGQKLLQLHFAHKESYMDCSNLSATITCKWICKILVKIDNYIKKVAIIPLTL